jgi:3-hydroxyisobutyrate dehydrogenase
VAKSAGAIHEKSLEGLAASSDLIIAMLPSGEVLSDIWFGHYHFSSHMQPGSILIDMGSSNPVQTKLTSNKLAVLNIEMLDAPVMGGVAFAQDASLDFLVGGNVELIEKCEPIFSAMGRSFTHCGPIGSGHALKALTNYINTIAMASTVEAISIGKAFGIDELVMGKSLIETCTGRNHPLIKKVIPKILTKTYDSGMAVGLVEKDLKIAIEIANQNKSKHPLLEKTLEIVGSMIKRIGPNADQTKVAKFWQS